jgi:hypothetical protein
MIQSSPRKAGILSKNKDFGLFHVRRHAMGAIAIPGQLGATMGATPPKRDAARKLLAAGVDPGEQRKADKAAGDDRAANSFEVIAREWFAKQSPTWVASHASEIIQRLERDVFPWLGKRPIADITVSVRPPHLPLASDLTHGRGSFSREAGDVKTSKGVVVGSAYCGMAA